MEKDMFISKFGGQTNERITTYTNEVDPILRRALYSLDCETKLAVIIALFRKGTRSFSQLMKDIGVDQSTLNYHLKKLIQGGLVENFYQKVPDTTEYSFYGLTKFCTDFLAQLFGLVSFPIVIEAEYQSIEFVPNSEVAIHVDN